MSRNNNNSNHHDSSIVDGDDIGKTLYPIVQDLTLIEYGGGGGGSSRGATAASGAAAASGVGAGASASIAGCCAFDHPDYDIVEVVAHGTMSLLDLSLPTLDVHLQHQRRQHHQRSSLTNCSSSMDDTGSSSNPFSSLSRSNSTGTGTGTSATASRQKLTSALHLRRESSSSSSSASSSSHGLLKKPKTGDQRGHARTLSNTSLANTSAATVTTSAATFLHSNHHSRHHHHHHHYNDFPHDEVDNEEEELVDKDRHRTTIETDPNATTSTSSTTKQAQAAMSPPSPPSPPMQERTFDHDYVLTRQVCTIIYRYHLRIFCTSTIAIHMSAPAAASPRRLLIPLAISCFNVIENSPGYVYHLALTDL
jgi:hypothetical protein